MVSNEAVEMSQQTHQEELWRFPSRYIKSVISLEMHRLRTDQEIREVFHSHLLDYFARLLDLLVNEFSGYLADFYRFQMGEVTSCEESVTDCEVHDELE